MEKLITTQHWYIKDVFRWRTGASMVWSLILLPFIAAVYTLLIKISIFHPYQWIIDWLVTTISFSGVVYIVLIAILNLLVAMGNLLCYTVVPVIHVNRLSIILGVAKPSRLLHIVCHTLVGGMTARCWSLLIGHSYDSLSMPSDEGALQYLNDNHLFLVLHGAYMGFLYGFRYFHKKAHQMNFPITKQYKYLQVKVYLTSNLRDSFIFTIRATGYFYILFYLFASVPKHWLQVNLNLQESLTPLNSILGLLSPTLLWNVLLTGAVTNYIWSVTLQLFKIFNTESYQFPIEASFAHQEDHCLHKALIEKRWPLVRYLAYQDLSLLAESEPNRRQLLFSLSKPGGHPHNWTNVSQACLSLINSLTQRLSAYQEWMTCNLAQKRRSQGSGADKSGTSSSNGKAETPTSWYIPKEPNRPYQRPWVVSPINPISVADSVFGPTLGTPQVLGQDLLHDTVFADSMTENTRCDALGTGAAPLNRPLLHGEQRKSSAADCLQWALSPWQYRLDFLRTWHLGARLLDPFQESQSRALFADAQLHIWALEAVTSLVVSSYHEDTYGVVQGTLADVLISMLDLKNAVEKHFKLPTSLPRWGPKDIRLVRSGPLHPDDKLRFDLKSIVKTSLQRIIKVFGPHLNNVQLGPIYKKKLALLMELK